LNTSPYSIIALKRNAVYFLTGKVASALLIFINMIWVVRLLPVEEYGAYMVLLSGMDLAQAITSLGFPWLAARYLPEFRLHACGRQLAHFVWRVITLIGLCLVAGSLILFLALPWLLVPMKLAQHIEVAKLYLLVLVVEGLGANIRESILGPLLLQGHAQISLVARNLALLLFLGIVVVFQCQNRVHLNHSEFTEFVASMSKVFSGKGTVNLYQAVLVEFSASMSQVFAGKGAVHLDRLVMVELAASGLGTLMALQSLVKYLCANSHLPRQDGWKPPKWSSMRSTARHMYFSNLVTMTYGTDVFVFLIQRFLGVEATALFGFMCGLYGRLGLYLPATLLFSLIRPKLIASYTGGGGMTALTHNANLAGKLSLFVLMPILAFSWLDGGELLSLLSGGKFIHTDYYLAVLLLALIPLSQRQILETVAVACDRSYLCFWGSSLGVLVVPLAYWLLESGQGLWGPIIARIGSHQIFVMALIISLSRATTYRPDVIGFFKLSTAALASFLLARLIPISADGWSGLIIKIMLSAGFFLLAAFVMKAFNMEDRRKMKRLLNK